MRIFTTFDEVAKYNEGYVWNNCIKRTMRIFTTFDEVAKYNEGYVWNNCIKRTMRIFTTFDDFKYRNEGYVWNNCIFCKFRTLQLLNGDVKLFIEHRTKCPSNGLAFRPRKLTILCA